MPVFSPETLISSNTGNINCSKNLFLIPMLFSPYQQKASSNEYSENGIYQSTILLHLVTKCHNSSHINLGGYAKLHF